MLTLDQIKNASDLKSKEVAVPEWGGSVRVASLTSDEKDAFEAAEAARKAAGEQSLTGFRARLAIATVRGEDGKPLFSAADEEWLGKKSASALSRIFNAAARLNHMLPEDVKELAGN